MKDIFVVIATIQTLLFLTIVYGVSKSILKYDIFVVLTKVTTIIIFMLSIYIITFT